MLEREGAATLWELWSESVDDLRKYASSFELGWRWPLSLCHGWGAGAIPIATRHLLGLEPLSPGWGSVRLDPATGLGWSWRGELPTSFGPIVVERPEPDAPLRYDLPKGIQLVGSVPSGCTLRRV
jgi:hypothetical protein